MNTGLAAVHEELCQTQCLRDSKQSNTSQHGLHGPVAVVPSEKCVKKEPARGKRPKHVGDVVDTGLECSFDAGCALTLDRPPQNRLATGLLGYRMNGQKNHAH